MLISGALMRSLVIHGHRGKNAVSLFARCSRLIIVIVSKRETANIHSI